MRSCRVFAILLSVVGVCNAKHLDCALNGAEALDEMMDSAIYIWAAVNRCKGPDTVECEVDISSAVESVSGMINIIAKAVLQCDGVMTENQACGLAASKLVQGSAGLSAGVGGLVSKCHQKRLTLSGKNALHNVGAVVSTRSWLEASNKYGHADFGACIVNIKDVTKQLFMAVKEMMNIKNECSGDDDFKCAQKSIKVVATFAALGEFLAGTIGHCTKNQKGLKETAFCGEMSMKLVHHLSNVASAAVEIKEKCSGPKSSRLYELQDGVMSNGKTSWATMALAASLPLAAVFSFVVGLRAGRRQSQSFPSEANAEAFQ